MYVCMYACVQMIHGFLPILLLVEVVMLSCRGFVLSFVVSKGFSIIDCAFAFFPKFFLSCNDSSLILKSFLFRDPIIFLMWALPKSEIQFQQRFHLSNVSPCVCVCESFIKNCVQPGLVYTSTTCGLVLTFGSFYLFLCLGRLTPS